jgi:excisionase family DNA binding protein
MSISSNPVWGSIDAAAERLGVTTKTIRRCIARGELKAYRLGSKMIRIDMNDVDAMLRPIPTTKASA